jgi:hypothetical protein
LKLENLKVDIVFATSENSASLFSALECQIGPDDPNMIIVFVYFNIRESIFLFPLSDIEALAFLSMKPLYVSLLIRFLFHFFFPILENWMIIAADYSQIGLR